MERRHTTLGAPPPRQAVAPPPQQCKAGVSARSHACYQRVNWTPSRHRSESPPQTCRYHLAITRAVTPDQTDVADPPITTLRGATVAADPRRVGRFLIGACVAALAIAVVVLFVSGEQRNNQIAALKLHGVRVADTVSGCVEQLGGSGSNGVGYRCSGSYAIGGRVYEATLPGSAFHAPGSRIEAVVDASDPSVFSTVSTLDSEHVSASVFVAPIVMSVVLVLILGTILIRRRRVRFGSNAAVAALAPVGHR